ncbi:hypothetical protein EON65_37880 [archaeon]|nr:MAG: hypothetical protein EON65_37880 [archaeon]
MLEYAESLDSKMGIFMKPVDADEAPSYYEIVTNPMDLASIRLVMNGFVYEYGVYLCVLTLV